MIETPGRPAKDGAAAGPESDAAAVPKGEAAPKGDAPAPKGEAAPKGDAVDKGDPPAAPAG